MRCLKCNGKMEVQDTRNYKSYDEIVDVPAPQNNNYDHRWHYCPDCGSVLQSAAKFIPGTFLEGAYFDQTKNLPLFERSNNSEN